MPCGIFKGKGWAIAMPIGRLRSCLASVSLVSAGCNVTVPAMAGCSLRAGPAWPDGLRATSSDTRLKLSRSGRMLCAVDTVYVTAVWRVGSAGSLVIVQESGSNIAVQVLDPGTCRWQGPNYLALSGVRITRRAVSIVPHCEKETMESNLSHCASATVLLPDATCSKLLSSARLSRDLTQRVLGFAFLGRADIRDVGTPSARLTKLYGNQPNP